MAERYWAVYAWPVEYGVTGRRVFFINQRGDVLCSSNLGSYSGHAKPPPFAAAFRAGSSGLLSDSVAVCAEGTDGRSWQVVQ
jgi:hypothetical protein